MATSKKKQTPAPFITPSGLPWPFGDLDELGRMTRALGLDTSMRVAGPAGLTMTARRSWGTRRDDETRQEDETQRDWEVPLSIAALRRRRRGWETDPDWSTDPRFTARVASALGWPGEGGYVTPGRVGLGYHPDLRDRRDLCLSRLHARTPDADGPSAARQRRTAELFAGQLGHATAPPPPRVNNIRWCSPVEDQGPLGSCTAQAVVGMVEYMQRRSGNQHVDGSRLFLYKVARRLQGWTGDTGCYLRTTIKAVAAFGVPPEAYWPYDIDRFEDEPSAFLYSFAANYQAMAYARFDMPDVSGDDLLLDVKAALSGGLGVVFGFPVYSSARSDGEFPVPDVDADRLLGGHAVMAVGYDDAHDWGDPQGRTGALLVRNSWGPAWGYSGYGFIPYEYVTSGLAQDFWTISKAEWRDLEFD